MIKRIISIACITILTSIASGQNLQDFYNDKEYKKVIAFAADSDTISPTGLYMIGYSFFQLENDDKAIEFYDKAINKGLDSAYVYYFKALAFRYAHRFSESITAFNIALGKDPENQMYLSEKGLTYYHAKQLDSALITFLEAQTLPNDYQAPFFMAGHIYDLKTEYDKALEEFYKALNHISDDSEYYVSVLMDIGRIEYTVTKNYKKSAEAYKEVIRLYPENYEIYPKLIKAYNANKEYAKADEVFNLVRLAFERNELDEDEMNFKNIPVDEFEWNNQKLIVFRYFIAPQETLDVSYKIFLLNEDASKVERTFMIEKTLELPKGPKHLLCEKDKKSGSHITYSYGWKTDDLSIEDIKKAVVLVLDGKIKPGGSSSLGK